MVFLRLLYRDDVLDLGLAVETDLSLGSELDAAFLGGVDGVILAEGRVSAGKGVESLLSDDDRADLRLLARVELDSKVSWIRISTVLCFTGCFFCCHGLIF